MVQLSEDAELLDNLISMLYPVHPVIPNSYDKVLYLLEPTPENHKLVGKRVTVIDYPDNRIRIEYEGHNLTYREFDKLTQVHQAEIVTHKRLGSMLAFIQHEQQKQPHEKRSVRCPTRRYPAPAALK